MPDPDLERIIIDLQRRRAELERIQWQERANSSAPEPPPQERDDPQNDIEVK